MHTRLAELTAQIKKTPGWRRVGRVTHITSDLLHVSGFSDQAQIGHQTHLVCADGTRARGEVIEVNQDVCVVMPYGAVPNIRLSSPVYLNESPDVLFPSDAWIGRIIDPFGCPLDGFPLSEGSVGRPIKPNPPPASQRNGLGARLNTGFAVLNTFLPIVEGQRVGLFAGSGVGKSSLLAGLCQRVEADVIVLAMIGERGREVRHFVENTLGRDGMKRTIVIAATSDQSAPVRRRCAWTAMTVAEHFRDKGQRVLFLADSITRFAEAHRDIALATGEVPALRGFPPSTAQLIMSLCERAGPGQQDQGSITAMFSVLVAGSDFDEPIADIVRGVLDGHIVLDRKIAERGRYPAIDLPKSVSRSLPHAATESENAQLQDGRSLLSLYEQSETMIKAGLYAEGSDPKLDRAVRAWPELDGFIAKQGDDSIQASFDRLTLILRRAGPA